MTLPAPPADQGEWLETIEYHLLATFNNLRDLTPVDPGWLAVRTRRDGSAIGEPVVAMALADKVVAPIGLYGEDLGPIFTFTHTEKSEGVPVFLVMSSSGPLPAEEGRLVGSVKYEYVGAKR